MKKNKLVILFFCSFLLLVSCKSITWNPKNLYENMEILYYDNTSAYEFKNESSDKLVIYIEGSGETSVLGIKNADGWESVCTGAIIIEALQNTHTIFFPEKFDWQPGSDYSYDVDAKMNYTMENLINCYLQSINSYLSDHSYDSIVLMGFSEGAFLLPLLYEKIEKSNRIDALIAIGGGGFSLYESTEVTAASDLSPEAAKRRYTYLIDKYKQETTRPQNPVVQDTPDPLYIWFRSYIGYTPFDYYKNVPIPVLFIHGEKDYNVTVESTRYVQKNLPDKPFEYLYYKDMAHFPLDYKGITMLQKDVTGWLLKKGL